MRAKFEIASSMTSSCAAPSSYYQFQFRLHTLRTQHGRLDMTESPKVLNCDGPDIDKRRQWLIHRRGVTAN